MTVRKLITLTADPKVARQIAELAAPTFRVVFARGKEAVESILRDDPAVAVLLVDHAADAAAADAIRLLELAQERRADVRRGLITGYYDVGAVVRALHGGSVQFVLQRPIVPAEFLAALA